MAYYQRLRDLKEDNDLTQKQVAELIGVSMNHYGKYERGEIDIPLEKAIILADHYHVTLDYLAGRTLHPRNDDSTEIPLDEQQLLDTFRSLTERQKGKLELFAEQLSQQKSRAKNILTGAV